MTLDGRITWKRYLDAEIYEDTPETKGPRGLAEASVVPVRFEAGPTEELITFTFLGDQSPRYFVPRDVLKAALKIRPQGP